MKSIDVMTFHVWVWRICGVWPPSNHPLWYSFYSMILFGLAFVIFPTLIVLNLFVVTNINGVIETLLPLSTCALASVKGFVVYVKRNKLHQLFGIIEQLDAAVETKEQRQIIDKALKDSRKLIILLSCLYYGGVNSAFLLAFLNKERILMWPSLMPFSYKDNLSLYNTIMFYQYISSLLVALIDTSVDNYGSSLNILLEGHLSVLGMRLCDLGFDQRLSTPKRNESLNRWSKNRFHEQNMKECANYHRLCISFSKCLDDILSFHYLIQFATSGLVICVSAFQLSVLSPFSDFSRFLFVCEYLFSMTIEIFIPCYFGTLVTIKSNDLLLFVYKSNWIEQTKIFKSSMRIFSERAKSPIVPFAGGLFIIGLSTFISILRAAYSLLAFLKSFQ